MNQKVDVDWQGNEINLEDYVAIPKGRGWSNVELPTKFVEAIAEGTMLAARAFQHVLGIFVVSSVDPTETVCVRHLTFWVGGPHNIVRARQSVELKVRLAFDFTTDVVEVNAANRRQMRTLTDPFSNARHLWKTKAMLISERQR